MPGLASRAEQVDPFLDDLLYGADDAADDLDDRVLVWVGFELRLKRGAVGVAQIGVDVDLADPDPGSLPGVVTNMMIGIAFGAALLASAPAIVAYFVPPAAVWRSRRRSAHTASRAGSTTRRRWRH